MKKENSRCNVLAHQWKPFLTQVKHMIKYSGSEYFDKFCKQSVVHLLNFKVENVWAMIC